MDAVSERSTFAVRSSSALDRVEKLYLKALRAALLIVATILILCAVAWAGINLMKVMRSPSSVVEAPSAVSASEIALPVSHTSGRSAALEVKQDQLGKQRSYYDNFVKRYYSLYRSKFQPYIRSDDKTLSIGEFDDVTIDSASRLNAIRQGDLSFETDKQDLEAFLPVVTEASSSAATADRLAKYRVAKKQPVTSTVQRTRFETRRGWDSYSESCAAWYESPIGCAVNRRVEVPYRERVTVLRYPNGISSPSEVLKSYQDKYFGLLSERRSANAMKANAEKQEIAAGNVAGWAGLSQSVLIAGAFLVLMFFFLLVAIERHQRRLTSSI